MKTISLRFAAVVSAIFVTLAAFPAHAADIALEQLRINGAIPVKAAGPYVEPGTVRIQVSTKLGRPSTVLPDGTWMYDNHSIQDSDARGTLVVRFNQGRVSELALVTPTIAVAMRTNPHQPLSSYLVAAK